MTQRHQARSYKLYGLAPARLLFGTLELPVAGAVLGLWLYAASTLDQIFAFHLGFLMVPRFDLMPKMRETAMCVRNPLVKD